MPPASTRPEPKASVGDVFRYFGHASRKYWYLPVITTVCITVSSVGQVIIPLYYKRFFDILAPANGAASGNIARVSAAPSLIHILVIILGINAVMWLVYRTATFSDNYYQSWVSAVLRMQAFEYLIDHSYGFFANTFGGSLVQRINRYIRAFGTLIDQITWTILPLTIQIVGVAIVLFRVKAFFAWVILIWTFIFLLFNFFFARFKMKYDLASAAADSKTVAYMSDVITNHTSTQFFTGQEYEATRFGELSHEQARLSIFAWNLSGIVDGVQASLIFVLEFFVFYFAVKYWSQGAFTVGTFVLLQSYIIGLGNQRWGFSRVVRTVSETLANSRETLDILVAPHDIKDVANATQLQVSKAIIEYRNVRFEFNKDKPVLKGINLTINSREKVALIGPSGAGKSTFVRLLFRLYDPTGGGIYIDDQSIHDVTQTSLRASIGFVPQDPVLFHRSLLENIRYGRRSATDAEVLEAAKLARCDEFIKDLPLGYQTLVGERGIKLSGGERQRVAIARAILKNAPILILDEATSSLDSASERFIQEALTELMKNKTVIVIAHRLSTIRTMDRIVVLEGGQVVEEGSHDTLLENPASLYHKLWSLQAGGFLKDDEQDAEEPAESVE